MRIFKALLLLFLMSVPFSFAHAALIYRTINHYNIHGKTSADIDKGLANNGPYLESTGAKHPGATNIRFDAQFDYQQQGRYCKVTRVNVNIHAKVSLPRWVERKYTRDLSLAIVWDTLYNDIRRHEESHIVIARAHASDIEYKVRALPWRHNCQDMQRDVEKVTLVTLQKHDRAQQYFDYVEAINFDERFSNLLMYRLQKLVN